MKALVVIQTHPSGQKNVSFSPDLNAAVDDMVLSAGGWIDSTVVSGQVLIVAESPEIEAALMDELRSVNNRFELEPITQR